MTNRLPDQPTPALSFAGVAITEEHLAEVYDALYSADPAVYGKFRPYGSHDARVPEFLDYVLRRVPAGSSVLEVGCGRGTLLRALLARGYAAEGTEISRWLLAHDLAGLPARYLPCGRLGEVPDKSFDAVTCNDVLEHLPNEAAALRALADLARIARSHVLVSVGTSLALRYAKLLGIEGRLATGNVHLVIRAAKWWRAQYERLCVLDHTTGHKTSLFLFGRVR